MRFTVHYGPAVFFRFALYHGPAHDLFHAGPARYHRAMDTDKLPPRIIVRLELTPPTKEALHVIARKGGLTQVAIASRLLEWFATQDSMVQSAVLGHYPMAIQSEIAALIMKRMGKRNK